MQALETVMNLGHLGAKYAKGIILILQRGVHKLNRMQMILLEENNYNHSFRRNSQTLSWNNQGHVD